MTPCDSLAMNVTDRHTLHEVRMMKRAIQKPESARTTFLVQFARMAKPCLLTETQK